jgi:hypothetical protein
MNTGNISWEVKAAGAQYSQPYLFVPIVMKYGIPQPPETLWAGPGQ